MERDHTNQTHRIIEEQFLGRLYEAGLKNDPQGCKEVVQVVGVERGMALVAGRGSEECIRWLPLEVLKGDSDDGFAFWVREITPIDSSL